MCIVHPSYFFGLFDGWDVEVDDDRFLSAAYENAFERLVGAGVDLLMRNERWNVNEITGPGFGGEFQMVAPTHACFAFHDVDYAFKVAVMMRSSFGIWMDVDSARPELRRAGRCVGNRSSAIHPWCLRCVAVQVTGVNYADTVIFPIRFVGHIPQICVNPSNHRHPGLSRSKKEIDHG